MYIKELNFNKVLKLQISDIIFIVYNIQQKKTFKVTGTFIKIDH